MNPAESQQYDLGRQARRAGYASSACNIATTSALRSWWLAGWHDEDIELKSKGVTQEARRQRRYVVR